VSLVVFLGGQYHITAHSSRARIVTATSGQLVGRAGLIRTLALQMSIDTTGKWWVGSAPEDLEEYLAAYSSDGYESSVFRLALCTCGSVQFKLEADDNEGTARRTCTACRMEHFICDSEDYWSDAEPETWQCVECHSSSANVGVGFALYADSSDIKWLYVGARCSTCGVLGCFAGWKVGYGPSNDLLNRV